MSIVRGWKHFVITSCFVSWAHFASGTQEYAVSLVGTSTRMDGPNCFNFTFLHAGVNNRVRHASTPELEFFVKTLCKRVSPAEERSGDLRFIAANVPIYGKMYIHSYVLNGLGTVLTKNGLNRRFAYKTQTTQEVLDTWLVDQNPNCRSGSFDTSGCAAFVEIQRCTSFNEFVSSRPLHPELKKQLRRFDGVEEEVEDHAMRGNGSLDSLKRSTENLSSNINATSSICGEYSPHNRLVLKALAVQTHSLLKYVQANTNTAFFTGDFLFKDDNYVWREDKEFKFPSLPNCGPAHTITNHHEHG